MFCLEWCQDENVSLVLKKGHLIKRGDYAQVRHFVVLPGKVNYYTLPSSSLCNVKDQVARGTMLLQGEKECSIYPSSFSISLTGVSPSGRILNWTLQATTESEFQQWTTAFRT